MSAGVFGCMRAWRAGLAVLALAALASCGSGEQVEPFEPTRILSFGDEQSLLEGIPNGLKYSVNFFNTTTSLTECSSFPIWTQLLAANFGLTYAECNPNGVTNPQGHILAEPGAKVADFQVQINDFLQQGNAFGSRDLVTVFVGMHDILEIYEQFNADPTLAASALLQRAKARGAALAGQINRIADADGRVVYTTIHDLGLSPFGRAEKARVPTGIDRAALLSDLTDEFNLGVKINARNDGRLIGLVTGDELSKIIVNNASVNGFTNVSTGVCNPDLEVLTDCTSQTLVTDGSATTFYWAGSTYLSPGGHSQLGAAAINRARNNPF
jgi:outer membrane lipase/esterase